MTDITYDMVAYVIGTVFDDVEVLKTFPEVKTKVTDLVYSRLANAVQAHKSVDNFIGGVKETDKPKYTMAEIETMRQAVADELEGIVGSNVRYNERGPFWSTVELRLKTYLEAGVKIDEIEGKTS